jgi:SAM-dependent methyltransferase
MNMNVLDTPFEELQQYYDTVLNVDRSTYLSTNDECTPLDCVREMLTKVPEELWKRDNLRILDPCCGHGNFGIVLYDILCRGHGWDPDTVLESVLSFNDVQTARLDTVRRVFRDDIYPLQITESDFLTTTYDNTFDLVVANPPYAKILENGARASKNHNLIQAFLDKALSILRPNGYLVFITPDNWMSWADRNVLIEVLTRLQIVHLDIHRAKRYFKRVGSSFTWYVIQNCAAYQDISVAGIWKNREYTSQIPPQPRRYIPLLFSKVVQDILNKTIDNENLDKFEVETSSDLHRYTKRAFIRDEPDEDHTYRLIHTPKQTAWASRPHKYQEGWKVFLSTTDKYKVWVDDCGMTQSIAFIRCASEAEAKKIQWILEHPVYVFINNLCRWGNFNNVRVMQHFPIPLLIHSYDAIYSSFKLTRDEIVYMSMWGVKV